MTENVQHPLYDLALEQALIGYFLLHNTAIPIARPLVKPEDFYDPVHQLIVELTYEFEERGEEITPITLNSWIKHNPAVQEVNKLYGEDLPPGREGAIYLGSLAGSAPISLNVQGYATLIADYSMRRRAVEAMGLAQDMIAARERSVPQPIMPALQLVVALADEISEKQMLRETDSRSYVHVDELLREIESQAVSDHAFGIKTEIDPLDEILGALYPGQLIVAGGRPGMGKSILGTNFARKAAEQGSSADVWSIEMPKRENAARLICDADYDHAIAENLKILHYEDFVKMRATGPMMHRAAQVRSRIAELNIEVFDRGRVRMSEIAAITRARAARDQSGKPRIVIVDHMHRLTPEDRYKGRRVDELSEITGMAKDLAKRINGVVVLLCQLSRDIERRDDKHPYMADFRDSGSIEQDADVVLALYRGAYYAEQTIRNAKNEEQKTKALREIDEYHNILDIDVLKQRSGKTGLVKCWIDPKAGAIRSGYPAAKTRQGDMYEPLNSIEGRK